MKKIFYLVAVCLFIFGGCKGSRALPADYFFGEFVYFADAAVFYDCATGRRFPVSTEGAYLQAEKGYTALHPEPGERMMIRFHGRIADLPSAEEVAGTVPTVIIDSLLGFDREGRCSRDFLIPGFYESTTDSIRQLLVLKPDYTYKLSHFSGDTEDSTAGKWGLASELELVLQPAGNDVKQVLFEIIPDPQSLSLSANGSDKPLIYNKVYL